MLGDDEVEVEADRSGEGDSGVRLVAENGLVGQLAHGDVAIHGDHGAEGAPELQLDVPYWHDLHADLAGDHVGLPVREGVEPVRRSVGGVDYPLLTDQVSVVNAHQEPPLLILAEQQVEAEAPALRGVGRVVGRGGDRRRRAEAVELQRVVGGELEDAPLPARGCGRRLVGFLRALGGGLYVIGNVLHRGGGAEGNDGDVENVPAAPEGVGGFGAGEAGWNRPHPPAGVVSPNGGVARPFLADDFHLSGAGVHNFGTDPQVPLPVGEVCSTTDQDEPDWVALLGGHLNVWSSP